MFSVNILPKPEEVILFTMYFERRWYVATKKKKKLNFDVTNKTQYSRKVYLLNQLTGILLDDDSFTVYLIKNSQPLISSSGANYFWPKSFVGNVHLLNQDWLFNRYFISVTIESYFGSFIIAFVLKFAVKSMIPLS